jgi:hypothetical protein
MADPVAEAREQLQRRMRCGQCHNEMLEACGAELDALIAAVRAEERERCAQVADTRMQAHRDADDPIRYYMCKDMAAAIRARGTV